MAVLDRSRDARIGGERFLEHILHVADEDRRRAHIDLHQRRSALTADEALARKKLLKRAPISLRIAKNVLNASWSAGQETATLLESLALSSLCGTEDKQEGVTSFLEKRKPSYSGR